MSLQGALAEHVREGKEIITGAVALDGTNPTPVFTGLANLDAVSLTLGGSTAPGVGTSTLTYEVLGSTVNIYAWKPTSSADATLIASTGTETVSYALVGRRRK